MKKTAPHLSSDFFIQNRERLTGKIPPSSFCIVHSGNNIPSSHDAYFPFRVDSDFYYLTGIEEPDCFFMIVKTQTREVIQQLFIDPVDSEDERWNGEMLTKERAREISGIKKIEEKGVLRKYLNLYSGKFPNIFINFNDTRPLEATGRNIQLANEIRLAIPTIDIRKIMPTVRELRMAKTPEEISYITKAADVTTKAFNDVAQFIKPGVHEFQVEAKLTHAYQMEGCGHAFEPIVASGKNACVLHYNNNSKALVDGDLVLIDSGARWGMYNADVTRVFPVNGKFSERQKFLYEVNLEIMEEVLGVLKVGMSASTIYKKAGEIQGKTLAKHCLLDDAEKHINITVHRIGHPIGLDVHDPSDIETPYPPNSIITIEPGLYLPEEGIGIRIEDDVLLHPDGNKNLTAQIPKKVKDIENLMA